MTGQELQNLIIKAGFTKAKIFITDGNYARPTTSYLMGQFYDFYQAWMADHDLYKWRDKWDCDNFSSTYYVFAQICHTKSARPEEGISVGELFYYPAGGGHAINLAVTEKGLIVIEPQTGRELELADVEKESAVMIRF